MRQNIYQVCQFSSLDIFCLGCETISRTPTRGSPANRFASLAKYVKRTKMANFFGTLPNKFCCLSVKVLTYSCRGCALHKPGLQQFCQYFRYKWLFLVKMHEIQKLQLITVLAWCFVMWLTLFWILITMLCFYFPTLQIHLHSQSDISQVSNLGFAVAPGMHTLVALSYATVSIHYTLYTIHCTLYTIHYTLYTIHCTLYTVHYTLYTIHCTLYTVHCTLYTIYKALL
jgi:hypothetical protein